MKLMFAYGAFMKVVTSLKNMRALFLPDMKITWVTYLYLNGI